MFIFIPEFPEVVLGRQWTAVTQMSRCCLPFASVCEEPTSLQVAGQHILEIHIPGPTQGPTQENLQKIGRECSNNMQHSVSNMQNTMLKNMQKNTQKYDSKHVTPPECAKKVC